MISDSGLVIPAGSWSLQSLGQAGNSSLWQVLIYGFREEISRKILTVGADIFPFHREGEMSWDQTALVLILGDKLQGFLTRVLQALQSGQRNIQPKSLWWGEMEIVGKGWKYWEKGGDGEKGMEILGEGWRYWGRDGDSGKRMEILGKGWTYWGRDGDTGKRMDILGQGWRHWEKEGDTGKGMEILGQGWRYWERDGDGEKGMDILRKGWTYWGRDGAAVKAGCACIKLALHHSAEGI